MPFSSTILYIFWLILIKFLIKKVFNLIFHVLLRLFGGITLIFIPLVAVSPPCFSIH